MSRSQYVSKEERQRKAAISRSIKKITNGYGFGIPKCAICGKEFTEQEIIDENLVYAVGRGHAAQMHVPCFRKEFMKGVGKK